MEALIPPQKGALSALSTRGWRRHWCQLLCSLSILFVCLILRPTQVEAQTPPFTAFQLQQYRPSLDPNGLFQTHSADTMGQWAFLAGFSFHYSWSPLFLSERGTNRQIDLINHQLGLDLSLGLGLLPFLDLVVTLPMTAYQEGSLPNLDLLGQDAGRSLTGFFLGDVNVRAKLQAFNQRAHGVSFAILAQLGIPSGNENTFNGEDTVSFSIAAALSRYFDRFELAFNFGYRYLPETVFLALTIGHELFYNVGVSVSVVPKTFDVLAELHGSIGLSGGVDKVNSPMGLLAGIRVFPLGSRVLAIHLGAGIGIIGGYGSPGFRGFLNLVWNPSSGKRTRDVFSDRDNDGIDDRADRCPGQKGPRSNQGCPLQDLDRDGIPDQQDRCPRQAGPKSNQGCPIVGDSDGDGVPDNVDQCPRTAGTAAFKGCPPGDRDGDGVLDKLDKCPNVAGPPSNQGCPPAVAPDPRAGVAQLNKRDRDGDGVLDKLDRCPGLPGSVRRRGCPRKVLVKLSVRRRRIYLRRRVRFRTSTRMYRKTRAIFRQLARMMKSFPTMQIRIDATTFSRSRRRWVIRRSYYHARSIRRYLIKQGIDKKRITFRARRRYTRRRYTRTYYRITVRRF